MGGLVNRVMLVFLVCLRGTVCTCKILFVFVFGFTCLCGYRRLYVCVGFPERVRGVRGVWIFVLFLLRFCEIEILMCGILYVSMFDSARVRDRGLVFLVFVCVVLGYLLFIH